MATFQQSMQEFKQQLAASSLPQAYQGLMEYILGLRTHLQNKYPGQFMSGSLYTGYMDMTYFSLTPRSLQERKLKIAIVFVYQTFRFEVWLAAANKQVQSHYWQLFKRSGWQHYPLLPDIKGQDSIIEHVLADDPDFGDLDALTARIETGTLEFIEKIEAFLSGLPD